MAHITFPASSYPGRTPQESAGRLINAHIEPLGPGARNVGVLRRSPGLKEFSDGADADPAVTVTGYRGAMFSSPNVYAAFSETLVYTASDGEMTEIDDLEGSDYVFFARNNKTPTPDLTVVTNQGWFSFDTAAVAEIVDADLPAPNSVCFLDGYFFLGIGDGRCFASGLNATTIDALDFTQAEAKNDTLTRVVAFERQLLLCGSASIEIFTNTGNATGFPFSRVAVIPRGLASARGITGFEDGFAKGLFWVGDDAGIHTLIGYGATKISTPDVDRSISSVADRSTIEAFCWISNGGHAFVAFSCPTWTWIYDLTTEEWHEGVSFEQTCWRRTGNIVAAFGLWLCGDRLSGRIMKIDDARYSEDGQPLVFQIESAPAQDFPNGIAVPQACFDFVSGTGIANGIEPIETEPRCLISWSDNGGQSWSNPLVREIGTQASNPRITVNRTGRTAQQGRRWRVQVSDPVYCAFLGGEMPGIISRKAS